MRTIVWITPVAGILYLVNWAFNDQGNELLGLTLIALLLTALVFTAWSAMMDAEEFRENRRQKEEEDT